MYIFVFRRILALCAFLLGPYFAHFLQSYSSCPLDGISHHDVHIDVSGPTREIDGLDHFEAELSVNSRIGGVATLEVTRPVFQIALEGIRVVRTRSKANR